MADTGRDLVKFDIPDVLNAIAQDDISINDLTPYRVLNRMKIIQNLTSEEIKAKFGEGSLIIIPTMLPLANKGIPIVITPLFFFMEYFAIADINDKGGERKSDKTMDAKNPIAVKALNPKHRIEKYGQDGRFIMKYKDCASFACMIQDGEFKGNIVVLPFMGGERFNGTNFINTLTVRRSPSGNPYPYWSQRIRMWTELKTVPNTSKKWQGFSYKYDEQPYISAEEVPVFQRLSKELRDDYNKQRIATVDDMVDQDVEVNEEKAPF